MANNQKYTLSTDKKPCMAWFETGDCPQGDGCNFDHHQNLHPTSHEKVHKDLVVSNEVGQSCARCLAKMLKVSNTSLVPIDNSTTDTT